MNTLNKIFSAAATAVVLLSSNAAFADTSRADVVAELAHARASGATAAMNSDDQDHFLQASAVARNSQVSSAKTRAQVIAELRASQKDGTLALLHSEDSTDQIRVTQMLQNKAAAPVMAE